ncbi:MAG TPA: hypothetical protein VKH41_13945 [Myxococcota bacterium]|nr:hypothetical protein [Myxococcota bacterium]
MTPRAPSVRAQRHLALFAGIAWIGLHYWIFASFFPNQYGNLGSDYGYFLPQLLDGEFGRIANGPFAIQWFTPAFCGGIPKFPNPQSLSFSVPQLLTFLTDPITGVRLTLLAFAALGYAGFYRFQRRLFGISRPIATLGAALFLFNTCFSSRMLIGHLTFHAFMLVPWLPPWLFARGGPSWRERGLEIAGAAGVLAYLASQAIAHVLFQALLFTAIAGLLQAAIAPERCTPRRSALRVAAAVPLSLALCAAKLAAMAAFLSQFPRTLYPLASVASIPDLLHLVFHSLFLSPSEELIRAVVVNTKFLIEPHEFEYGVTPLPLVLVGLALLRRRAEGRPVVPRGPLRGVRGACLAGAVLLLAIPLALNFHHPVWHAWLKSLPIFASSFTLFRWLSVYVPIAILAGTAALDSSTSLARHRGWVAAAGCAWLAWHELSVDRTYYQRQIYDPAPVREAFAAARRGAAPSIHANALPSSSDLLAPSRNTAMAHGESQLACYETLFGFQMENLPRGALREGPVLEVRDGAFNLNDPSCFVFPAANECTPGTPFPASRRADAEAFASYRAFPFRMPLAQHIADAVNAAALSAVGAGIALAALDRLRRCSARDL